MLNRIRIGICRCRYSNGINGRLFEKLQFRFAIRKYVLYKRYNINIYLSNQSLQLHEIY